MLRFLKRLIFLGLLGGVLYFYRGPLKTLWHEQYDRYFPCRSPLTYTLGSFDTRFSLSKEDFLKAIKMAETAWEKPLGKDLFSYVADGELKINLVFDYRQEATLKLRNLGLIVSDNQASYDTLRATYRTMKEENERKKDTYEANIFAFNTRSDTHNKEIEYWNSRKGAPRSEYERITREGASLKEELAGIKVIEADLKRQVDDINALVVVINQVANNINANADEFNKIGRARGEEFTEGLYTRDASGVKIDIYQYNDMAKLVRVLMHELGHALSLEHIDDPTAIMYRLNQGTNSEPNANDIAALKTHCGIK